MEATEVSHQLRLPIRWIRNTTAQIRASAETAAVLDEDIVVARSKRPLPPPPPRPPLPLVVVLVPVPGILLMVDLVLQAAVPTALCMSAPP